MSCEIEIDTSRVWQVGDSLGWGRNVNYDSLWGSIERLDSNLNSLREFNDPNGYVCSHVDKAQNFMRQCKSECIEPTTNTMAAMASFLKNVAVQYENTEAAISNLFEKYPGVAGRESADWFANLIVAGLIAANDVYNGVADFVAQCQENAVKYINEDPLGFVLDCVAIVTAGVLIATGVGAPLGLAILAVNVIPSVYRICSGGRDIWNDATVAALTNIVGAEAAQKAGTIASLVGAAASLVVPSGAALSKGYKAFKSADSAGKGALEAAKSMGKEYFNSYKSMHENVDIKGVIENPVIKASSEIIKKKYPNSALNIVSDLKDPGKAMGYVTKKRKTLESESYGLKIANTNSSKISNTYGKIDTFHGIYDDGKTAVESCGTITEPQKKDTATTPTPIDGWQRESQN